MCERYVRKADKQRIAEAFHLGKLPEGFVLPPDYNTAPTTYQPVIRLNRDTGEREMVMMRWLDSQLCEVPGGCEGTKQRQREG